MMTVTKEELDELMRRWLAYADDIKLDRDTEGFATMEKMFLLGAFSGMLDIPVSELTNVMVPAIVLQSWTSGRPVSAAGNWDKDAPDQRLSGASITYAQRIAMFPRGGDEA